MKPGLPVFSKDYSEVYVTAPKAPSLEAWVCVCGGGLQVTSAVTGRLANSSSSVEQQ